MRDLCKQSPAVLTAAVARYRCLAVNNNLTEAAETELRINMLCECEPGLAAFKLIYTRTF